MEDWLTAGHRASALVIGAVLLVVGWVTWRAFRWLVHKAGRGR